MDKQPQLSGHFTEYDHILRPYDEQLDVLQSLDGRMTKSLRPPKWWFNGVDTSSNHIQSVEDLEFPFVVFETLEQTFHYNQKLIELTQPYFQGKSYGLDERNMTLHSTAKRYKPGIHRVRINLIDEWYESSVDKVRNGARKKRKQLGAVEGIGAYGLQNPELLQSQDGKNLPYLVLVGIQTRYYNTDPLDDALSLSREDKYWLKLSVIGSNEVDCDRKFAYASLL